MTNYVIIGGGIGGLAQAYKLSSDKNNQVTLIERSNELGGRARQIEFHDLLVPTGAGVGRQRKDKKLLELMQAMEIKPIFYNHNVNYDKSIPNIVDIKSIIQQFKQVIENHKNKLELSCMNFAQFAIKQLGLERYEAFVDTVGYSDFENLDVTDALYNYGFDDTYSHGQQNFYVPWNRLITNLETVIKANSARILLNRQVKDLDLPNKSLLLSNGETLSYDKIILAIPPACIDLKFAEMVKTDFRTIKHQPFAYLYAVIHDRKFRERFPVFTVVTRPIQKIIPMDPRKNVYMVAYCDNSSAEYLNETIKCCKDVEELIQQFLGMQVTVSDYKLVYRDIGTHYRTNHLLYKPSPMLKGEAFALNQGWTNGAL
jgi:hypothetical protein